MSRLVTSVVLTLLAGACARSEDVPEEALEAAEAEAPPAAAVPVADPVDAPPPAPVAAEWQEARRGEGMTLRLVTADDTVLMSLACANVPREIVATVPAFVRDPAENRFSLNMGSAPIFLVADPSTTTEGQSVVARAPVPSNLAAQMRAASEITAVYGNARLGPYPAPGGDMTRDLLGSCGVAAEEPGAPLVVEE